MITRILSSIIIALGMSVGFSFQTTVAAEPDFRSNAATQGSGVTIWFYGSSVVKAGNHLLSEGNFVEAANVTETALLFNLTHQDQWIAQNILCIAYMHAEAALLALEHCDDAIELRPTSWQAYNNRGNAKLAVARYEEAIADYETALKLTKKRGEDRDPPSRNQALDTEDDSTSPSKVNGNAPVLPETAVDNPEEIIRKNLQLARERLNSLEETS